MHWAVMFALLLFIAFGLLMYGAVTYNDRLIVLGVSMVIVLAILAPFIRASEIGLNNQSTDDIQTSVASEVGVE